MAVSDKTAHVAFKPLNLVWGDSLGWRKSGRRHPRRTKGSLPSSRNCCSIRIHGQRLTLLNIYRDVTNEMAQARSKVVRWAIPEMVRHPITPLSSWARSPVGLP